jgi:hypothetical protein
MRISPLFSKLARASPMHVVIRWPLLVRPCAVNKDDLLPAALKLSIHTEQFAAVISRNS